MRLNETVRYIKGRKKGSACCQRVVTFCRRLAAFQKSLGGNSDTLSDNFPTVSAARGRAESPPAEMASFPPDSQVRGRSVTASAKMSTVSAARGRAESPPAEMASFPPDSHVRGRSETLPDDKSAFRKASGPSVNIKRKCKSVKDKGGKRRKKTEETCHSCRYSYGSADDPLIDDEWLKCSKCNNWSHESCGELMKDAIGFVCNVCC